MALTANKVLVSDNNGDVTASSTDSSKLAYIGSLTSNAEQTGNKVTSLSSANTDTQYPSAKAVYDEIVPNVSASYTAVSNKGGTLPATQNLANLATAIGSIPSGYSEIPSYQISSGVLSRRSITLTGTEFSNVTSISDYGLYYVFSHSALTGSLDFSSVTTIGNSGLYYSFWNNTGITSVDFSSLVSVGTQACRSSFSGCTGITSVDLSSLQTVPYRGLEQCFVDCTGITSVDLSSLVSIGSAGLLTCFSGCTNLTGPINFTSLSSIQDGGLQNGFSRCTKLTDVYFNSLTTQSFSYEGEFFWSVFSNMLGNTGTDFTHTLHFPSNLQSTIADLDGYPNFGGTSGYVVLAFDLPSTS